MIIKDQQEAQRLWLPLNLYLEFRKKGKLKICIPEESCSYGDITGVLNSIIEQYHDAFEIRNPEHKKARELFVGSLFGYVLQQITKNEFVICIPAHDDKGIDLYLREINFRNKRIIIHPIQICEFLEKYNPVASAYNDGIIKFIVETKFLVAPDNLYLLIWFELKNKRRLNKEDILEIRNKLKSTNPPYRQIVVIALAKDKVFNLVSLYSQNYEDNFALEYDFTTQSVGAVQI